MIESPNLDFDIGVVWESNQISNIKASLKFSIFIEYNFLTNTVVEPDPAEN